MTAPELEPLPEGVLETRFIPMREDYSTGSDRGDPIFTESGDASSAATMLTLGDRALAVVSNTRYNARGYDVRMELHGSADSIAVEMDDKLPLRSAEPGVTFPGWRAVPVLRGPSR